MAKSKAKIELGKLIMAHRTLEAYAKERVCVKLAYKIFLFRKKAAEHEEFFSGKVNGIINTCSGRPEKLCDRVERFIRENGYTIKLAYGKFPDRPYDSKAVWADNSKIQQILKNK